MTSAILADIERCKQLYSAKVGFQMISQRKAMTDVAVSMPCNQKDSQASVWDHKPAWEPFDGAQAFNTA